MNCSLLVCYQMNTYCTMYQICTPKNLNKDYWSTISLRFFYLNVICLTQQVTCHFFKLISGIAICEWKSFPGKSRSRSQCNSFKPSSVLRRVPLCVHGGSHRDRNANITPLQSALKHRILIPWTRLTSHTAAHSDSLWNFLSLSCIWILKNFTRMYKLGQK